jgi:hypothetical protein
VRCREMLRGLLGGCVRRSRRLGILEIVLGRRVEWLGLHVLRGGLGRCRLDRGRGVLGVRARGLRRKRGRGVGLRVRGCQRGGGPVLVTGAFGAAPFTLCPVARAFVGGPFGDGL